MKCRIAAPAYAGYGTLPATAIPQRWLDAPLPEGTIAALWGLLDSIRRTAGVPAGRVPIPPGDFRTGGPVIKRQQHASGAGVGNRALIRALRRLEHQKEQRHP